MNKIKSVVTAVLYCIILFSFAVFCWLKKPSEFSSAERRPLEQFPLLNYKTILSGDFMNAFENYATDQFPLRDSFRSLKANTAYFLFHQFDNNGIYRVHESLSKIEYPLNENMLENASNKFNSIYTLYMKDKNITPNFSIVPDKNYFMAQPNGYLSFNYDELTKIMINNTEYMRYIDIFDQLDLSDYYQTDTHWKQESIVEIANTLCDFMNTSCATEYKINAVMNDDHSLKDFNGVYVGQSALNVTPDYLYYLTNDTLDQCKVYSYSSGKKQEIELYNFEKANGKDPYEMYLNGSEALLVIENPNAASKKELVVFRDSFGSSLVPLMVEGYSKITVIDIRYMESSIIGNYVEFNNQDVLFIYSTLLLNNSMSLR